MVFEHNTSLLMWMVCTVYGVFIVFAGLVKLQVLHAVQMELKPTNVWLLSLLHFLEMNNAL